MTVALRFKCAHKQLTNSAKINWPPTGSESVEPLPVRRDVRGHLPGLCSQPNRAAYQLFERVILDERAQVERLEATEDDRLGEVALASTVFAGVDVAAFLVVGLVAEAGVGETSSVELTPASGVRVRTLTRKSTRPVGTVT